MFSRIHFRILRVTLKGISCQSVPGLDCGSRVADKMNSWAQSQSPVWGI